MSLSVLPTDLTLCPQCIFCAPCSEFSSEHPHAHWLPLSRLEAGLGLSPKLLLPCPSLCSVHSVQAKALRAVLDFRLPLFSTSRLFDRSLKCLLSIFSVPGPVPISENSHVLLALIGLRIYQGRQMLSYHQSVNHLELCQKFPKGAQGLVSPKSCCFYLLHGSF